MRPWADLLRGSGLRVPGVGSDLCGGLEDSWLGLP